MRKKGVVYRATTLLGLTVIALQFGGELVYSKYFRNQRDEDLHQVPVLSTNTTVGKSPRRED